MPTLVHLLHLLAGIVWAGGSVVFYLILFPMIAGLPANIAKPTMMRLNRPMTLLMGTSAVLVLVFGLLRAWTGGKIDGLAGLTAPYGLAVLGSVAIWVALEGVGGGFRARMRRRMDDAAAHAAEAPADARRTAAITLVLLLALIVLMAVMGLGLV